MLGFNLLTIQYGFVETCFVKPFVGKGKSDTHNTAAEQKRYYMLAIFLGFALPKRKTVKRYTPQVRDLSPFSTMEGEEFFGHSPQLFVNT